jgi:hypothetical protein
VSVEFRVRVGQFARRVGIKPTAALIAGSSDDYDSLRECEKYAVQYLCNGDFDTHLGDVDYCTFSFMQGSTTLHSGPKPQHIVVEEKVADWIREKRIMDYGFDLILIKIK